ncbi:MAG: hypothetical protein ACJAZO_001612 [Myxococcota bacterium]|jgi:hypothetical protein
MPVSPTSALTSLFRAGLLLGFAGLISGCDPTTPSGNGTAPEPEPEPNPTTCAQAYDAVAAEQDSIQACTADAECGQVLTGTSCGCTRDLVARTDANADRFYELLAIQSDLECGGLVSTCDCPPADGFACVDSACTWDYIDGRSL